MSKSTSQTRGSGSPGAVVMTHHPDPLINAEVEAERLHGLLYEARAALVHALSYRAATPEGLAIKRDIRDALRRTSPGGADPFLKHAVAGPAS